jgi:hypothetical protein
MSIQFKKGYILIVWPKLVRWVGRLTTGSNTARAFAAFPFIAATDTDAYTAWVINHELIHFRQQIETLFIGLPLLSFFERQYAKWILKKSKMERYLYAASEQEAYINQQDSDYLSKRRFGTVFKYLKHKRNFTFGKPGEIVYLDT